MKRLALILLVCVMLFPMCAQARLFNSDHEEFKWQLADHLETFINWTYGGTSDNMDIYYGIAEQQPLFMMLLEDGRAMCGVNVTEYIPTYNNQSTVRNLMKVIDVVINTVDMHYYHSDISARTVDAVLSQALNQIARDGDLSRYYHTPGEYVYSAMGMDFYQNISYSYEDSMYVYSLSIFPW